MKTIVFIKPFATLNKGDEFKCDSMLANRLVRIEKVAKYKREKEEVDEEVKK